MAPPRVASLQPVERGEQEQVQHAAVDLPSRLSLGAGGRGGRVSPLPP
jgi:hypothetical protein